MTDVLHVALQDGFEGDPVTVTIDGRAVFDSPSVRTDTRISLATSFEVPLPSRVFSFEVRLPARQLQTERPLDPADGKYIAVSIRAGVVTIRTASQPFRYA